MMPLVLNIFFECLFFHVIRVSQVRGSNMMGVAAVNYLLASSVCFGISFLEGNPFISGTTIFLGTVQGIAFISSFYLICLSMNLSGLAIATAILRLSIVIPIFASIFYWGEIPSPSQFFGILVCMIALPLIGTRPLNDGRKGRIDRRDLWILGTLFINMGIANVVSKAFVESRVPDSQTTFMAVLFGVAGLGAVGSFLLPTYRKHFAGLWRGVTVGILNVASILSFLVALGRISGVVVFLVQGAGGLVLNTLFARVVWNERFTYLTIFGMGVAAVGLVLVNIH